jgi:hypothetical protein
MVRAEPSVLAGTRFPCRSTSRANSDLGVVEVVDADVRPGDGEQFGQPGSPSGSATKN